MRIRVYAQDLSLFDTLENYRITLKNKHKGDTWLAFIEGITNKEDADALRGTKLYCDRDVMPEPDDDEVSQFSADYQAPKNIIPIQPIYPEIQKSMGVEGKVYVKFWVDKHGNVDPNKVTIVKGIVGLNEAAIDAVKRSRWKPAMQRDRKVGVYMTVPVNFNLPD